MLKYRFAAAAGLMACMATTADAASIITQWTFNSASPDANTATGTTLPAFGADTTSLLGTTATFASGDASGGSSDPSVGDDSGWNLTSFPANGTGDKTEGVVFAVSTLGYSGIQLGYDLRHSNTSSRYEAVQYSTDGVNFVDVGTFDGNLGDTWFNGRTVDLTGVAGVNNNPNFAFRVLATFAPLGSAYLPSNPASTYGTTGTWRFDMTTVSGTAVVPVPAALPLLMSAFGLLAIARRRVAR